MLGIDGVLLALIITFIILFGAILSGFPVAFAIGGAGVLSFAVVALLDTAGLLTHTIVDVSSPEYKELSETGNFTARNIQIQLPRPAPDNRACIPRRLGKGGQPDAVIRCQPGE